MMTLIFALIFSVTIQECIGGVCAEICDGTISTAPGSLNVYQVNCADDIFKNGFD